MAVRTLFEGWESFYSGTYNALEETTRLSILIVAESLLDFGL